MKRALVRWAGDHRRYGSCLAKELGRIDLATVLPVTVPRSLRNFVSVRRGGMQLNSHLKLAFLAGHVWPRPMYAQNPFFSMLVRREN